jgi:hypothetical protein
MAYAAPSKATFVAAFPAFAAVTDDQYTFWSDAAARVTEPHLDCLGDSMDLATMLATAHYLTEAGIGTGVESEVAAQGMGGFKSIKSGSLSLQRGEGPGVSVGMWGSTGYGARFLALAGGCVSGPRVAATGALPVGAVPFYEV